MRWSTEELRKKSRAELVDIAKELNIDGLFNMNSTEIVEAIRRTLKNQDESTSSGESYTTEIRNEKLA
jgi:hypothetical protein